MAEDVVRRADVGQQRVLGKSSSGTIGTFVEDLAVLVEEAPNEQLEALEDDGTPLLRVQGGAVERRDLVACVRIVHRLLELVGAAEDLVLGEGLVVRDRIEDRSHRCVDASRRREGGGVSSLWTRERMISSLTE